LKTNLTQSSQSTQRKTKYKLKTKDRHELHGLHELRFTNYDLGFTIEKKKNI